MAPHPQEAARQTLCIRDVTNLLNPRSQCNFKLIDKLVCHPERSAAQSKDPRLFLSRRARISRFSEKSSPSRVGIARIWVTRVCPNPRAT
jgi:hypothetical protein